MSESDIVARLARACAHGTRQMGFVNELLAGPSYAEFNSFDHVSYGDSGLGAKSWRSTKKRLASNGFIVTLTPWDYTSRRRVVEMRFSV